MTDPFSFKPNLDITKIMAEFRLPAMPDMTELAKAQQKNLEAITAANKVALEGARAVAERHMEIVQQSVAEMQDAMRAMASPGDMQEQAAKRAEMAKAAYERAVGQMQELADLIQRSSGEALSVLHKRFAEAMEEVKNLSTDKKA
ncbi:MAG: phasin family protein [Roseomonas sp.]|jgi:phasin family protein|nr:phasin family protein [Roseomonas sp.]MCA3431580.1 phasin family protein [Roseomonas sp.]MCA3433251.1 phasin family protein [Roseomonas sp.]MCZ8276862.1 phasin family protein [Acetobacteraceae bacterium]